MPRLATIDPAQATGRAKELFEGPLKGKHRNIFKGLANSAAALEAYVALHGALSKGLLTPREQESIALVVAQLNHCDYCLAAHTLMGKMAGLDEPAMLHIRRGAVADPKLDALVKFVTAIHERRGNVTDEQVRNFKAAGYTDGHVAEVVANYALQLYTNYFNHVNDTPIDFPPAPALD
jgi:uncharacterized peroxidase-related enzyme